MTKTSSVFHDVNFLRLWFASVISSFGDSAYFILLGWFVISVTGSPLALGTALTAASIPRLIFMLVGGVAADRINRKVILMTSLSTRALVLILFSVVLMVHTQSFDPLLAYGLAVLFGVVDAFYWPASSSIVPLAVRTEDLPVANGLIQTSQQLSGIMGPLIASGLLFMHAYYFMFLTVALLYVISTVVLSYLRMHQLPVTLSQLASPDQTSSATSGPKSAWHDILEGIHYTLSIRILALIMVASLLINVLFMGPINIGMPVLVKQAGWPGSVYGTLEAFFGVGAIVGGLITSAAHGFRGHFKWLAPIGALMGIGMAFLGFIHVPWTGMVLTALMGASVSAVNIPIMTYIQTIVEQDKMGRVMSLLSFMSIGLVPVSYAASSLILQQQSIPLRLLLLICGLTMAVFWGAMLLLPSFRHMEDHPIWKGKTG